MTYVGSLDDKYAKQTGILKYFNFVQVAASKGTGMSEKEVFKTCLFHCILIVVSPIFTFFAAKIYLFDGKFKYIIIN